MYEAQQSDAANADAQADAARDGDIVDADYEEVNDEDDRKKTA
jgi:molecular chaperone DnaK